MDKTLRNILRHNVTRCRQLLEGSIAEVLQGQFGMHPDGRVEEAGRMAHLSANDLQYRQELAGHLRHHEALGLRPADAASLLVREVAYTHLNRLVAFKMMEDPSRGLISETVGRGQRSKGFLFFLADHPEEQKLWKEGQGEKAYRHFLEWLGEKLSAEVGSLFAAQDPANRLFPPPRVLEQVLALINDEALAGAWRENETIGWVYQYFTPKELREQARQESPAPRNSYELAFRNQFYTPRYVVQFLVDNTLGRLWYEMRRGDTALKEACSYLVYRPGEDLQRPKKDPREIRVLDPACGSGHFLLYAFDLFLAIYQEAWEDPASPAFPGTGRTLRADYADKEGFLRALPGLILRHNLYGIDIDPRAVQIAGLALWLRAQQAYQELGLPRDERPAITRANIVCAEPMPGEADLLAEFTAGLAPPFLGQLVQAVFRQMRLAAEAGSLSKIEVEIRAAIEQARRQWLARPKHEQLALWPAEQRPQVEQLTLFDLSGIDNESFWQEAEGRVMEALNAYADRAANGHAHQRRLFAGDAARGFAFIDLLRKRYDVVVMNPPFGDASKPARAYIEENYPRTRNDLYAAFVERGLELLHPGGFLGAITSRTGFFLSSFQKWREEILLKAARPVVVADLGSGVLDTAMVETAAYCLEAIK